MRNEYDVLLEVNEKVRIDYKERRTQWVGSPFEWLIRLPPRTVGSVGEELVEKWLEAQGFEVTPSNSTEFDRWCRLRGGSKTIRLEVKFSTLWEDRKYVFQQIRDQEYDALFCLGISPQSAHAWTIPKAMAWLNATSQHRGKQGQDTKWLHVDPESPPQWLTQYGGNLERALEQLKSLLK